MYCIRQRIILGLPNDIIQVEKLECKGLDEAYYIPSGEKDENYLDWL